MVNKITTPPTSNDVIGKINELVDDKQDTLTAGTGINISSNTISVANPVITNNSSSDTGIAIRGSGTVQSTQMGVYGSAASMSTAYGFSCYAFGSQAIAIGHGAQATGAKSYALGEQAKATAIGCFQFGFGENNEAGSVYFALQTSADGGGTNYKLLGSDGIIPNARLNIDTTPTSGSGNAISSGGAYTNLVRRKSTSSATGSTSQGVYVDANGQVQPCDAVTSTYAATGLAPVNGTAVSNAIATKQDNLVSGTNIKTINGNSLLGSGNITIETSSTPNVDGTTISYNSSDALQTIAVKNVRDNSTLPIWHGTEYQWNHGDPTTWYYWQTSVTALWTSGGSVSGSGTQSIEYGDNRFVLTIKNSNQTAYSTDGGVTWMTGGNLPSSGYWTITYGDGKFIAIKESSNQTAYSTDGGVTWMTGGNLPSSGYWIKPAYGGNRFVTIDSGSNKTAYSTDGGATWQSGGNLSSSNSWRSITYGDGRFVTITGTYGDTTTYSTDGGVTWTKGGNLPSYNSWWPVGYGNGRFIAASGYGNETAYSTDGGVTWAAGGELPIQYGNWRTIICGDGKFIATAMSSHISAYSLDSGVTWQSINMPSNNDLSWVPTGYGDNKFITGSWNSTDTAIFTVQYDKCYTDTANPTTTSVVYSEPETQSALTISSVTSGAITLSNNNTYYYNQSGNAYTYQTIGDAHPEYLCFIDGVGVKIGNTTIATNNSNNS